MSEALGRFAQWQPMDLWAIIPIPSPGERLSVHLVDQSSKAHLLGVRGEPAVGVLVPGDERE